MPPERGEVWLGDPGLALSWMHPLFRDVAFGSVALLGGSCGRIRKNRVAARMEKTL